LIRLLIADDHPLVRAGIRRILEGCNDIQVVGEAEQAADLVSVCRELGVQVVLADVSMPGPGIIQVLTTLQTELPEVRTLVLSMHPEEQYALRVLRAGAAGYLTKAHAPEELLIAIRKAAQGGVYVSPTLAETLARTLGAPAEEARAELSDREFQVLQLLAKGHTMKGIAARLELSPKTVSTYRARILEKLRLGSTADLIRYALEHGLHNPM
jgi:two-component system invasion response regulator UvrY